MRQARPLDDCFLHDKERLRHDDALALLKQRLGPLCDVEPVALAAAGGRILAEDVASPRDVPAIDNSAVDGYAFAHASLKGGDETWMPVVQRITAGAGPGAVLEAGAAARIFTGAPMPADADTVVMQEDTRSEIRNGQTFVAVPDALKRGANCRKAGEDVAAGALVARAGARLRPQEIAAIASTGKDTVACYAPLRIALVSTGDEVVRPGEPLQEGQLFDANYFMLRALLAATGAATTDLGILPDDETAVRSALLAAAAGHDVIISTGGASRGEEDHVVGVLREIGALHAWQIAVKPGRPLAFGQIGRTVFLGLPGNPVAVMVCFLLYGLPVLHRLGGADWREPARYAVRAGFSIRAKKPDRREFLRGTLERTGDGLIVRKFPRDGSALISSLTAADGLIELGEQVSAVKEGDPVAFIPFTEFGLPPG